MEPEISYTPESKFSQKKKESKFTEAFFLGSATINN
jgi:hypothetical protein